ncbi:uncharacterized protein [Eurosta solidaginis]|uniref:uncharacterized protein n=1 Tax=Eurosta solidaginis TaxID=178769 RepID=UPI00353123BC
MLLKQPIRNLHTAISCLARSIGRRSNPGIGHQLSTVEDVDQQLFEDPEGLDDLESDFMTVNKTHREYEREISEQRERVRHLMVKHKYFREPKLPNLLTYAEKEQIRMLHSRDPEEWPIERLAESFPATKEIIKKIISAKWQPRSAERVCKHDELVIQNWEKFRTDPKLLQLPQDFQAHLQKFAARRPEDLRALSAQVPVKPKLPLPKSQTFLSIITSCDKYADSNETNQLEAGGNPFNSGNSPTAAGEDETYLLSKVHDKRRMRLQELKKLKLSASELTASSSANEIVKGEEPSSTAHSIDKYTASAIKNPSGTGIISYNRLADLNLLEKYESSEIVISAEDQRRFEITRVKDRIHIPRKLWQKGATYRVVDAYYDDDGEFLYRVPGMSGGIQ